MCRVPHAHLNDEQHPNAPTATDLEWMTYVDT